MPHVFSLSGAVPPPPPLLAMYSPKSWHARESRNGTQDVSLYAVFSVLSAFLARGRGEKEKKEKKLCVRIYSRTAQVSGQCVCVRVIVHDAAPPRV